MQETSFRVGNERLHGVHWAPKGQARGAVVLVHGFNSSFDEFGRTGEWLADAGFHALAFDQRGFGKSEGELGRTHVDRAVEDILAAASHLVERSGSGRNPGNRPQFIVGHSLGGAYAIAALGRPHPFRAAAVCQCVDRLWDDVQWWLKPAYHVMGSIASARMRMGMAPGTVGYRTSAMDLFVSKEAQAEAGRPDFLAKRANLGNYAFVRSMSASVWAQDVTVPVLSVVSAPDRAIRMAHSLNVHAHLRGPKRLVEHGGGHSCFRDFDGRKVVDAIIQWFGENGAAAA